MVIGIHEYKNPANWEDAAFKGMERLILEKNFSKFANWKNMLCKSRHILLYWTLKKNKEFLWNPNRKSDHKEGRIEFSAMFRDRSQIFFNKVLDERNCDKENEAPEWCDSNLKAKARVQKCERNSWITTTLPSSDVLPVTAKQQNGTKPTHRRTKLKQMVKLLKIKNWR